jgi:hypothetical protein
MVLQHTNQNAEIKVHIYGATEMCPNSPRVKALISRVAALGGGRNLKK